MIEQFINFVIRPPRAEYNPDEYLWESEFTLAGRQYKRHDLELTNQRGHTLQCSHYVPSVIPDNTALPCVIYCHGNSGCRVDANEAAVVLLPTNITVFTLDFSGSGLSGGKYVSLGWHEKEDIKTVVSYLRTSKQVSCIGLWGRSMGAVTSLLYGAEDPSIAGMVLDSAFSNLYNLMMELVDVYKIRLPRFTVRMGVQYMRRVIQKKAKFDIMDLNVVQFAPKSSIPALFGHASEDTFVQPHHADLICKSYAGDTNIIKFEGDHNSPRPQFFYDSVSIFFHNVLDPYHISRPPSKQNYYEGNLKAGAGTDEFLLCDIIHSLRKGGTNAGSSSNSSRSIPPSSGPITKSIIELLSESVASMSVKEEEGSLIHQASKTDMGEGVSKDCHLQEKTNVQTEECYSSSSSNTESWGRCSSLGKGSQGSPPVDHPDVSNTKHEKAIKATAVPHRKSARHVRGKSCDKLEENKRLAIPSSSKKQKHGVKLEKGDTISQRLKKSFLLARLPHHRRHQST